MWLFLPACVVAAQQFVMLTTQRSGSTYVMSLLRSVQKQGGPMHTVISEPVGQELRADKVSWAELSNMSWPRFRAIIDRAFARVGCGAAPCGFKIMYNQIPGSRNSPTSVSGSMLDYFVKRGVRVVHLIRRSHVRKVLSIARLARDGQAHVRDPTQLSAEPLAMSAMHVVGAVRESVRVSVAYRFDLRRRVPHELYDEVYYEDAVANATGFVAGLLAFVAATTAEDSMGWARRAATDILRNPVVPCADLVHDWPTIVDGLHRTMFTHDDPHLRAAMHRDLDFALEDCA